MADKPLLEIDVYNHHYTVRVHNIRGQIIMDKFVDKYTIPQYAKRKGKMELVSSVTYAAITKAKNEYRLHINTMFDFRYYLSELALGKGHISVTKHPLPEIVSADLKVKDGWTPRDYQKGYIDYLTKEDGVPSKLVGLQTGKGKTFIALYSIAQIGMRTLIYILPKYIDKWIGDVKNILDIDDDRLLVIRKGDELRMALELGKNNELDYDIIIISNRIYKNYIKEYEEVSGDAESFSYPVLPEDFCSTLGVGVTIVDETHQEFYNVFTFMLYSHIYRIIGLSATLVTNDKRLAKMYLLAYPSKDRYIDRSYDRYIHVYPVEYEFNRPEQIKYKDFHLGGYSHTQFEKSIIRQKWYLDDYLEMIKHYTDIGYIHRRKPGDKLAIFVATIKFATMVTDYLQKQYPDLDIRRYVQEDPYENIIDPDIRVTTVMSGGTAIDIPNLITVIQTVNIASQQANIQTVGRLRKIPDKEVRFYYTWCNQIDKHIQYHNGRLELLRPRVASITLMRYPHILGNSNKKTWR